MNVKYGLKLTKRLFETWTVLLLTAGQCRGQTYQQAMKIFQDKLSVDSYFPKVKPLLNQSHVLEVSTIFALTSIISVNDVQQIFKCSGYVIFGWYDQIVAWDPADYGGQSVIYAETKDIWRPRVTLANSIGDRFIFKSDDELLAVHCDGLVLWYPGKVFSTSCSLDMYKYPFDKQACTLQFEGIGWDNEGIRFIPGTEKVQPVDSYLSDEWELMDSEVANNANYIHFTLYLTRRPTYLLVNVILPVVIMSLMNIMVFLIPVDSGEKISYGITVLLALSVYLTAISSLLPRSSKQLPLLVIYIFTLLIISVLAVVDSIIVVFLHHLDQDRENTENSPNERTWVSSVTLATQEANIIDRTYLNYRQPEREATASIPELRFRGSNQEIVSTHLRKGDKYTSLGKRLNMASFIFFLILWLSVTLAFFIRISF